MSWLLLFTFTVLRLKGTAATPIKSLLNFETYSTAEVTDLVKWIILEHRFHAYSVRFLTTLSSTETINLWLNSFGQSHPLITGNVTSFQTGKPVIVMFLLFEDDEAFLQKDLSKYALHWINKFSNRQRDHFVFIGEKIKLLQLWKSDKINQLSHRWGFVYDSKEFMSRIEGYPLQPGFNSEVELLPAIRNNIGSNIRGRHLKIAGWAHVPPYHFIKGTNQMGNAEYDGSHVRIFQQASLLFNFTWELYSDEVAASYGQLLENGTWTGMVGSVHSGEYEACIYLGPQLLWYLMFDFAGTLSGAAVRFLIARPKSELQWQAFLYPFRVSLWIAIVLLFLLVLVVIFLLRNLTRSSISTNPTTYSKLVDSTTLAFQIAMEQTSIIPQGVRILCGAWLLFSIIMGTAYKSQVMSSLTFPFTEKPPATYRELANRKEYKSKLNNIGGLEVAYFQSNESQLITTIAKAMSYEPVPINCIEKAVLFPKTVCVGWCPFLEYTVAERASPDVQVSPIYISSDQVMQVTLSVAFQKNSPFTLGFTPIITSFWESGIYSVWENDVLHIHKSKGVLHYKEDPHTPLHRELKSIIDDITGGNGEKPLKISNLKIMAVVLTIGVCLAVIAFTFEQFFYYISKRSSLLINDPLVNRIAVQSSMWLQ